MRLAEKIKEHFGVNDGGEACRRLVHFFAPDLADKTDAVDVFKLAHSLNLKVVGVQNAKYEGRFSWDESGNETIELAPIGNHQRRRFTIAHEIGHWMLLQFLSIANGERFRNSHSNPLNLQEEERLANTIAAEILVPIGAVHRATSHQSITSGLVRSMSNQFDVSRQVILRRITDVLDTTLAHICVVPNRFKDLNSISIIDSAMYVVPREGLVKECGDVRIVRNIPFERFIATKSMRLAIIGSRGRVISDFDVTSFRQPIPYAELLAVDVYFRPVYQDFVQ